MACSAHGVACSWSSPCEFQTPYSWNSSRWTSSSVQFGYWCILESHPEQKLSPTVTIPGSNRNLDNHLGCCKAEVKALSSTNQQAKELTIVPTQSMTVARIRLALHINHTRSCQMVPRSTMLRVQKHVNPFHHTTATHPTAILFLQLQVRD